MSLRFVILKHLIILYMEYFILAEYRINPAVWSEIFIFGHFSIRLSKLYDYIN